MENVRFSIKNWTGNLLRKKSSYVAVKAHYKGNYPENLVGLYNFEGGYCGVSNVEDNKLNVCYIVDYRVFQQYKNIDGFQDSDTAIATKISMTYS